MPPAPAPIASSGAMKKRYRLAPDGRMISLNSSLATSANGCSRPNGPDAVGADAHLHVADHLALGIRHVGDGQDQRHRDADDLHERPDHRPDRRRDSPQQAPTTGPRATGRMQDDASIMPAPPDGPDSPSRPHVDACAAAMRTTPGGTRRRHGGEDRLAAALRHLDLRAVGKSQRVEQRTMHARLGRLASAVRCSDSARRTSASAK